LAIWGNVSIREEDNILSFYTTFVEKDMVGVARIRLMTIIPESVGAGNDNSIVFSIGCETEGGN